MARRSTQKTDRELIKHKLKHANADYAVSSDGVDYSDGDEQMEQANPHGGRRKGRRSRMPKEETRKGTGPQNSQNAGAKGAFLKYPPTVPRQLRCRFPKMPQGLFPQLPQHGTILSPSEYFDRARATPFSASHRLRCCSRPGSTCSSRVEKLYGGTKEEWLATLPHGEGSYTFVLANNEAFARRWEKHQLDAMELPPGVWPTKWNKAKHCYDSIESQLPSLHRIPPNHIILLANAWAPSHYRTWSGVAAPHPSPPTLESLTSSLPSPESSALGDRLVSVGDQHRALVEFINEPCISSSPDRAPDLSFLELTAIMSGGNGKGKSSYTLGPTKPEVGGGSIQGSGQLAQKDPAFFRPRLVAAGIGVERAEEFKRVWESRTAEVMERQGQLVGELMPLVLLPAEVEAIEARHYTNGSLTGGDPSNFYTSTLQLNYSPLARPSPPTTRSSPSSPSTGSTPSTRPSRSSASFSSQDHAGVSAVSSPGEDHPSDADNEDDEDEETVGSDGGGKVGERRQRGVGSAGGEGIEAVDGENGTEEEPDAGGAACEGNGKLPTGASHSLPRESAEQGKEGVEAQPDGGEEWTAKHRVEVTLGIRFGSPHTDPHDELLGWTVLLDLSNLRRGSHPGAFFDLRTSTYCEFEAGRRLIYFFPGVAPHVGSAPREAPPPEDAEQAEEEQHQKYSRSVGVCYPNSLSYLDSPPLATDPRSLLSHPALTASPPSAPPPLLARGEGVASFGSPANVAYLLTLIHSRRDRIEAVGERLARDLAGKVLGYLMEVELERYRVWALESGRLRRAVDEAEAEEGWEVLVRRWAFRHRLDNPLLLARLIANCNPFRWTTPTLELDAAANAVSLSSSTASPDFSFSDAGLSSPALLPLLSELSIRKSILRFEEQRDLAVSLHISSHSLHEMGGTYLRYRGYERVVDEQGSSTYARSAPSILPALPPLFSLPTFDLLTPFAEFLPLDLSSLTHLLPTVRVLKPLFRRAEPLALEHRARRPEEMRLVATWTAGFREKWQEWQAAKVEEYRSWAEYWQEHVGEEITASLVHSASAPLTPPPSLLLPAPLDQPFTFLLLNPDQQQAAAEPDGGFFLDANGATLPASTILVEPLFCDDEGPTTATADCSAPVGRGRAQLESDSDLSSTSSASGEEAEELMTSSKLSAAVGGQGVVESAPGHAAGVGQGGGGLTGDQELLVAVDGAVAEGEGVEGSGDGVVSNGHDGVGGVRVCGVDEEVSVEARAGGTPGRSTSPMLIEVVERDEAGGEDAPMADPDGRGMSAGTSSSGSDDEERVSVLMRGQQRARSTTASPAPSDTSVSSLTRSSPRRLRTADQPLFRSLSPSSPPRKRARTTCSTPVDTALQFSPSPAGPAHVDFSLPPFPPDAVSSFDIDLPDPPSLDSLPSLALGGSALGVGVDDEADKVEDVQLAGENDSGLPRSMLAQRTRGFEDVEEGGRLSSAESETEERLELLDAVPPLPPSQQDERAAEPGLAAPFSRPSSGDANATFASAPVAATPTPFSTSALSANSLPDSSTAADNDLDDLLIAGIVAQPLRRRGRNPAPASENLVVGWSEDEDEVKPKIKKRRNGVYVWEDVKDEPEVSALSLEWGEHDQVHPPHSRTPSQAFRICDSLTGKILTEVAAFSLVIPTAGSFSLSNPAHDSLSLFRDALATATSSSSSPANAAMTSISSLNSSWTAAAAPFSQLASDAREAEGVARICHARAAIGDAMLGAFLTEVVYPFVEAEVEATDWARLATQDEHGGGGVNLEVQWMEVKRRIGRMVMKKELRGSAVWVATGRRKKDLQYSLPLPVISSAPRTSPTFLHLPHKGKVASLTSIHFRSTTSHLLFSYLLLTLIPCPHLYLPPQLNDNELISTHTLVEQTRSSLFRRTSLSLLFATTFSTFAVFLLPSVISSIAEPQAVTHLRGKEGPDRWSGVLDFDFGAIPAWKHGLAAIATDVDVLAALGRFTDEPDVAAVLAAYFFRPLPPSLPASLSNAPFPPLRPRSSIGTGDGDSLSTIEPLPFKHFASALPRKSVGRVEPLPLNIPTWVRPKRIALADGEAKRVEQRRARQQDAAGETTTAESQSWFAFFLRECAMVMGMLEPDDGEWCAAKDRPKLRDFRRQLIEQPDRRLPFRSILPARQIFQFTSSTDPVQQLTAMMLARATLCGASPAVLRAVGEEWPEGWPSFDHWDEWLGREPWAGLKERGELGDSSAYGQSCDSLAFSRGAKDNPAAYFQHAGRFYRQLRALAATSSALPSFSSAVNLLRTFPPISMNGKTTKSLPGLQGSLIPILLISDLVEIGWVQAPTFEELQVQINTLSMGGRNGLTQLGFEREFGQNALEALVGVLNAAEEDGGPPNEFLQACASLGVVLDATFGEHVMCKSIRIDWGKVRRAGWWKQTPPFFRLSAPIWVRAAQSVRGYGADGVVQQRRR